MAKKKSKNKDVFTGWLGALLSSSSRASLRRFLALQSFYILVFIAIVAIFFNIPATNIPLLREIAKYMFMIVGIGIFGITVSGVVQMVTASKVEDKQSDVYYKPDVIVPGGKEEESIKVIDKPEHE